MGLIRIKIIIKIIQGYMHKIHQSIVGDQVLIRTVDQNKLIKKNNI